MKPYTPPSLEIVRLAPSDVITTSGEGVSTPWDELDLD